MPKTGQHGGGRDQTLYLDIFGYGWKICGPDFITWKPFIDLHCISLQLLKKDKKGMAGKDRKEPGA